MMNTTAAAGAFCFAIDDETTKLAIPTVFVRKTVGLQRMTPTPALCRLFMEGRCRQSSQCHQIHADVHVVEQLRREVLAAPPCCQMHTPWYSCATLPMSTRPIFIQIEAHAVPLASFLPTTLLQRIMLSHQCYDESSGPVVIVASRNDLCRNHTPSSTCRYGNDCSYLHLCTFASTDLLLHSSSSVALPQHSHRQRLHQPHENQPTQKELQTTTTPHPSQRGVGKSRSTFVQFREATTPTSLPLNPTTLGSVSLMRVQSEAVAAIILPTSNHPYPTAPVVFTPPPPPPRKMLPAEVSTLSASFWLSCGETNISDSPTRVQPSSSGEETINNKTSSSFTSMPNDVFFDAFSSQEAPPTPPSCNNDDEDVVEQTIADDADDDNSCMVRSPAAAVQQQQQPQPQPQPQRWTHNPYRPVVVLVAANTTQW